jgi:hypothetical protein
VATVTSGEGRRCWSQTGDRDSYGRGIITSEGLGAAEHEGVFVVVKYLARAIPVVLLVAAAVSVSGCGQMKGVTSQVVSSGSVAKADSSLEAWPKAEEAMKKVAPDAVLTSVGTGGLALADVPGSWNFTFYSASTGKLYRVAVEHGKVQPPTDFGGGKATLKVTQAVDISTIKVGAAEAVVKAREFGAKSGTVPKNVVVSGFFAETPSTAAETKPGAWHVIFASGTDLADAQEYDVDMMTGEVSSTPKK